MGLLGLAFPILLLALLVTIFVWFWLNRKVAVLLILLLFVGYKNINALFAWNSPAPFVQQKAPGTIRILGYNVRGFDTKDNRFDSANCFRWKILAYIRAQQADIVCIQDYVEMHNPLIPSNTNYLKDSLGFPYDYVSDDYKVYPPWGPSFAGIAIFSKYPLKNIQHVLYSGRAMPESVITADITINGSTKRVMVTHLQSMHLKPMKPEDKQPWDTPEDSAIIYSDKTLAKLTHFIPYHAQQSELVRQQIDASPYPVIYSADMNEVPTSYVYNNVKGSLKDVFLMKGNGLGQTYYRISPTLRIDYLLVSPSIDVVQYKKDNIFMSDHYPQVMDIKW